MLAAIRRRPVLAAVFVAYVAGISAGALLAHRPQSASYLATMLVVAVLVVRIDASVDLGTGVLWCLAVWGFVHMLGGLVPAGGTRVLYNVWLVGHALKYDQAVHAFGFGTAGVATWRAVRAYRLPPLRAAVVSALGGLGVGAINEVVEFGITRVVPDTNVGGFENTGWDLVANLAGCVAAAVLVYRRAATSRALDGV